MPIPTSGPPLPPAVPSSQPPEPLDERTLGMNPRPCTDIQREGNIAAAIKGFLHQQLQINYINQNPFDLRKISGYDPANHQVLINDHGVFKWVDTVTC